MVKFIVGCVVVVWNWVILRCSWKVYFVSVVNEVVLRFMLGIM